MLTRILKLWSVPIILGLFISAIGWTHQTIEARSSMTTVVHDHLAQQAGPQLSMPGDLSTEENTTVDVPVTFAGNGNDISTVIFSVVYDEALTFDETDSDEDGVPDAVTFDLPAAFSGSVPSVDTTNRTIGILIADLAPPLSGLEDSTVVTIQFTAGAVDTATTAGVGFGNTPETSFGNTDGVAVPGTTSDGAVRIIPDNTPPPSVTPTPDDGGTDDNPPPPMPLTPPRNLTARTGLDAVLLAWAPAPSTEAAGYHVYRRSADDADFTRLTTVATTGLNYRDIAATESRSYSYRVTSVDVAGTESTPSNEVMVSLGRLSLKIPEVRAEPGQSVRVPVTIENADGLCIGAMNIGLRYDPAIATVVGVERAALTAAYTFEHSTRDTADEVHIATISDSCQELVGPGAMFEIIFDVAQTATTNSDLNFIEGLIGTVIYDDDDLSTPVALNLEAGELVIRRDGDFTRGDLDGNSAVNSADAALALQIASEGEEPTAEQLAAGDINGDGVVDSSDASMILFFAANQEWPSAVPVALQSDTSQVQVVQVSPGTAVVEEGQTSFEIPITVNNGADVAGATFEVVYGAGLRYENIRLDAALVERNYEIQHHTVTTSTVRVSLAGDTPLGSGEHTLAWLRFTVQPAARLAQATTAPLRVSGAWLNDQTGRDFATSALSRTVLGNISQVSLPTTPTTTSRVYLPLVRK